MEAVNNTPFGTIVRSSWNQKHVTLVKLAERSVKRAVCGAPKKDGYPCKNAPKKDFAYYCQIHRPTIQAKMVDVSDVEPDVTPMTGEEPKKPAKQALGISDYQSEYVSKMFARCNNCPIRGAGCQAFMADSHCKIEEGLYINFTHELTQSAKLEVFDMPIVFQASMAFANNMRNRLLQAQSHPDDINYKNLNAVAIRESKEFRNAMRALNLTPQQRQKNVDRRIRDEKVDGIESLADLMSMPEGTEVEITKKTTIKKKSSDEQTYV